MTIPAGGQLASRPNVDLCRLRDFLAKARPALQARRAVERPRATAQVDMGRLQALLPKLSATLPAARSRGEMTDIWSVVGLGRNEVQTARVLTWLLDPRGNHGAGDAYLQAVWREIDGEGLLGFALEEPSQSLRENYPMGDLSNRIDIELTGRNFLLFIEVKIGAPEGPAQLERYMTLAKAKAANMQRPDNSNVVNWAVLYLTLGRPTVPQSNFIHISWRDLARAVRKTARASDKADFVGRIADSFASHIERL